MKIKTSELTGAALDFAVLGCLYPQRFETIQGFLRNWNSRTFHYSTDWLQGGPIIERARITVSPYSHDEFNNDGVEWLAILTDPEAFVGTNKYDTVFELCGQFTSRGLTPLIAAMRCYVASKLGDEVEVPDELCT